MTKVKETTAKNVGTSQSSAAKIQVDAKKEVHATRNGEERIFSKLTWDLLPADKQGWSIKSDKPADVPSSKASAADTAKTLADYKTALGAYFKEFSELPEGDLTTEQLNAAVKTSVDEKSKDDGKEDFTIDQEFLDLNPEIAADGKKVGDVIRVAKGGTV